MSCNGCRVLRKGCSESCMLRPCLEWIDSPESQAHATVFLAKFFGRAALFSFISNLPPLHRPPLFQSLLYEACGRTVNPVSGAVGLLWSGNWHVCQAAVDTVLRGGTLRPIPHFLINSPPSPPPSADTDDASEVVYPTWHNQCPASSNMVQDTINSTTTTTTNNTTITYSKSKLSSPPAAGFSNGKRRRKADEADQIHLISLSTPDSFPTPELMKRPETPSEEESATTFGGCMDHYNPHHPRLLNLFV